jgi:hypothetical protein
MILILFPDHFKLSLILLGLILTAAMVAFTLWGKRVGARFVAGADEDPPGLSAIEGALFSVFGLLVAFTFAGAMDRLQVRKDLLLKEAQTLSTAYGRVRLMPETFQGPMREAIRRFTDGLLGVYGSGETLEGIEAGLAGVERAGDQVLRLAVDACRTPEGSPFAEVVLPPINDLLDTAKARRTSLRSHPPTVIYEILILLALLCAFLGGFAMARSRKLSWTHILAFAVTSGVMLCVTLDIEYPRFGFIHIRKNDRILQEVRDEMR